MLSFFPRGVLDEILNLIESVSEDFPSYSSMKAPCPMDVNSWSEALLHQYVINLVVVFPIWAVPCPSSRLFVRVNGVYLY